MSVVFVDTGAWVALVNAREKLHSKARDSYASLAAQGRQLATSSDVLDETTTRLRYDVGLKAALAFRDAVESAQKRRLLRVVWVDASVHRQAWSLLERHRDVELSFTDATSVAIARSLKLKTVFGFDGDFRALGFELLPA